MEFQNEFSGFTEKELEDVDECVSNLLSTIAGEQGLDRDFGIDTSGITDMTTEEAENMLTIEVIEKIDRYEPRAEVDDIEFIYSVEGRVSPKIYFKKRESEDEQD